MFKKVIWITLFSAVAVFVSSAVMLLSYKPQPESGSPDAWRQAMDKAWGPAEYTKVDINHPLSEQTRTVRLAGRIFDIPLIYIDGRLDSGLDQVGINMIYVLPDFTSRLSFASQEAYQQAFEDRRFGHLLIQPSTDHASFDEMIDRRIGSNVETIHIGVNNDLEAYHWYRLRRGQKTLYSEIYIERNRDSHSIESYMRCSAEESGAITPGCTHKFRDKGLYYSVYYNKDKYFAEWRDIREKAIEFIDLFEIHLEID